MTQSFWSRSGALIPMLTGFLWLLAAWTGGLAGLVVGALTGSMLLAAGAEADAADAALRGTWTLADAELELRARPGLGVVDLLSRRVFIDEPVDRATAAAAPEIGAPHETPPSLEEVEAIAIRRAMEFTGGKKGEAAQLLGIAWPTLRRKLRKYGLE